MGHGDFALDPLRYPAQIILTQSQDVWLNSPNDRSVPAPVASGAPTTASDRQREGALTSGGCQGRRPERRPGRVAVAGSAAEVRPGLRASGQQGRLKTSPAALGGGGPPGPQTRRRDDEVQTPRVRPRGAIVSLARLQAMLRPVLEPQTRELDSRLHGYQRRAVQHLWDHPRSALFMEMGLGKTATVLQALTPDHFPALVVAPKRVAELVWPTEGRIWRPDLKVAVAAGAKPKREAALRRTDAHITVIGRDNIADVPRDKYRTVILDELSSFKNKSTLRWRNTLNVTTRARYVWGLTGTPSPNGYIDLWAEVGLLDHGYRLYKTLTEYRNRYFQSYQVANGVNQYSLVPGSAARIDAKLSDICLSMQSADYLDIPEVVVNTVEVPMDAKTRKVYDEMVATLVATLEGQWVTAANAAVLSNKLSQITAGFLYPDPDDPDGVTQKLHDNKTDAVTEIVAETGTPVLVFYRFNHEREQLMKAMPYAVEIKQQRAVERWNRGEVPVMLAHPASAGHGLNLQHGGHVMVWTTLPWSLEEYLQANARLSRQGQDKPVIRHFLITPDSIDARIWAALEGKRSVQDALLYALGLDNESRSMVG